MIMLAFSSACSPFVQRAHFYVGQTQVVKLCGYRHVLLVVNDHQHLLDLFAGCVHRLLIVPRHIYMQRFFVAVGRLAVPSSARDLLNAASTANGDLDFCSGMTQFFNSKK